MIANFKIKSMRYLMALAMVLISLSPISCKKEKGGSSELREIVITHPENGTMTIIQGESELIKYSTVPAEAEYEVALEWTSDDENVATVKNGRVKAHAPGTTTVHAKYESVSASVKVTVTAVPVTSFGVPSSMSAYLDMPTPVRLTVQPENANAASLQWDTDNPDIAYVEVNQGVAYIKAAKEGSCTISAYAENISTTRKIKVAVYPTIFKLMRKSISDESGYVEVKNEDSFDIADIGVPDYEGKRAIEMIRADGEKLKETSVQISSDNPNVISVTKRPRSETKVLIFAVEGKEFGAAKITASLNEEGSTFTKTFTVSKGIKPFTSDTKICYMYTDEQVKDVEEMARNATMEVQITPAANASWTSSNEAVAKVTARGSGANGTSPAAEIKTFGEYGSAEITATDESGKNTRKFTVRVSKASFPAGTKICIRVNGKLEPVGESTTIRASYDGRNDEAFGLMDASGNYLSTFTNFKWTIESPACECRLSPVGASGVVVAPISTTTFSGSKTATLVCTDDAGNQLRHKIIIYSPIAFGRNALGAKVNSQMFYEDAKVDIGNKAVVALYGNKKVPVTLAGLKWSGLEKLNSYGSVNISTNNSNTISYFEFTPNQKMESVTITVEDEIGQEQTLRIQSAAFQFPKDAKIYISYYKSTWSTSDDCLFFNNGSTYFRVGTSATDFVKFGSPVKWSCVKTYPKLNYSSTLRSLPSGDASIYALSPTSYPNDYANDDYTLVAKDAYGTEISARFKVKKFMNFNDGCWFRLDHTPNEPSSNYKFGDGKDVYVTLPSNSSYKVGMTCCPKEKGNTVYVNRAEISDFKNGSISTRTEKPVFRAKITVKREEYARITFYDDYGNKKAFYIKHK